MRDVEGRVAVPRHARMRWGAVAAALALGLAACGSEMPSDDPEGSPTVRPTDRAAADTVASFRGEPATLPLGSLSAKDIGTAQRAFGRDLYAQLCAAEPGSNLAISPASAADALGLLWRGADPGDVRDAVGKLLHLPGWNNDVMAALAARTAAIARLADDADARVLESNRVWIQSGLQPADGYLDDVATAYDATLRALDFGGDPGGATDAINKQVSDDTQELIPKLFESLDPSTVAVLTNAIYLKADWATPFDGESPDAPFTRLDGSAVQVPMMGSSQASFRGTHAAGWTSAVLPYKGDTLRAVVLLPPADWDGCALPGAEAYDQLRQGSEDALVAMPRFSVDAPVDGFAEALMALGLPGGPYSQLAPESQLSSAVQKVVVKVDEKGTEAAAATGLAVETSARIAPLELILDRPFLFTIEDTATGSPLFWVRVADPSA